MKCNNLSWSVNVRNLLKKMKLKVSTVMLVGLVACSLAGFAQDKSTVPQDGTTAAGVSAVPQEGNAAQPAAAADAAQSGVAASQAAAPVAGGTTAPAEPAAPAATATPTEGTAQAPDAATAAPAQPADSTAQPQAGAGNNNAPATTDQAQTPAANPNTSAAQAPAAPAQQSESGTPDQADASKPPANAAQAEDSTVVRAKDTPPAGSANGTNAPAQPGAVIPLIVMDDVPLTDAIKNLARQAGLNHMLDPKIGFGQPGPDGKVLNPSVSIRWENVTAEQALGALLKTYNLQMVEDPKTKIALITVKDPAAPDPLITKIIQLKFSHPTNLVGSVQTLFTDKRSKVVPDIRTSQLVVLAT
ncbi:MAG: hypothetical protein DME25_06950, partial [Verrucomicrobia bacterium]